MTNQATHVSAADSPASSELHQVERGLKTASLITIGFGLVFAFGSHDATDLPLRLLSDMAFLRPGDGVSSLTDVNHLADAILGGVMAGWAVMIWMLTDRLLIKAPQDVRAIVLGSLLVWFPIDTLGSIASGAWLNGLLNVGFLAMFLVPLVRIPRSPVS